MTYSEIRERADVVAKRAMLYVPIGWVACLVYAVCFAQNIAAGMLGSVALAVILLVLFLAPSYLLEAFERITDRYCPHIWANNKSAIIKQVARREGLPVIDIKLSEMDPRDLKGLPE